MNRPLVHPALFRPPAFQGHCYGRLQRYPSLRISIRRQGQHIPRLLLVQCHRGQTRVAWFGGLARQRWRNWTVLPICPIYGEVVPQRCNSWDILQANSCRYQWKNSYMMAASFLRTVQPRALRHHHLPGNLPALASTSLSVTVPYRAAIADINQASMQGGRHTLRVCVETGGFTLDEITLEPKASGTCNDDGT